MTTADVRLEWVKPPLQARSQQTLERLLDAAEAILVEKGLEHATVAEIAKRAGSSVGAFYSRFSDKEALMRCVLQRFNDQAVATAEAVLTPARWQGVALEDALRTLLAFMLKMLHERRHLVLALMVRAASDAQLSAFGDRLHAALTRLFLELLEARGHVVLHPEPETAVHLAVWLVLSGMESRALRDTSDGAVASEGRPPLSDEVVAREITDLVLRYVGVQAPVPERRAVVAPTQQTLDQADM